MTYELKGSVGMLLNYTHDPERRKVTVRFDKPVSGVLITDTAKFEVRGGETACPVDKIETSSNLSFVDTDGKVFVLEPVNGNTHDLVRAIAELTDALDRRSADHEARLAVIERDFYPKDNGLF